jgi:hypothetical protein
MQWNRNLAEPSIFFPRYKNDIEAFPQISFLNGFQKIKNAAPVPSKLAVRRLGRKSL